MVPGGRGLGAGRGGSAAPRPPASQRRLAPAAQAPAVHGAAGPGAAGQPPAGQGGSEPSRAVPVPPLGASCQCPAALRGRRRPAPGPCWGSGGRALARRHPLQAAPSAGGEGAGWPQRAWGRLAGLREMGLWVPVPSEPCSRLWGSRRRSPSAASACPCCMALREQAGVPRPDAHLEIPRPSFGVPSARPPPARALCSVPALTAQARHSRAAPRTSGRTLPPAHKSRSAAAHNGLFQSHLLLPHVSVKCKEPWGERVKGINSAKMESRRCSRSLFNFLLL